MDYQPSIPFDETIEYLRRRGFEKMVEGELAQVEIKLRDPVVYVLPNDHRKKHSNSRYKLFPALTVIRKPVRVIWDVAGEDVIKRTGRLVLKGEIDYFALSPETNVRPIYLGCARKSLEFNTDYLIGATGLLRAPLEVVSRELLSHIEEKVLI